MPVPAAHRRGCSLWTLLGCGCGFTSLVGIALIFFTLSMLSLRERATPRANLQAYSRCQTNLRSLRRAIESYRLDRGRLPADLAELTPYVHTVAWLHCPLETEGGLPYRFTPAPAGRSDPLITCANHAFGPVVLLHSGRLRLSSGALRGAGWRVRPPSEERSHP